MCMCLFIVAVECYPGYDFKVHIEPHARKSELAHQHFDECVTEASATFKESTVVITPIVPSSLFF